jgi:hypothetical protein
MRVLERRLREVVAAIGELREEGYSWVELYALEAERRLLEWMIGFLLEDRRRWKGDGEKEV